MRVVPIDYPLIIGATAALLVSCSGDVSQVESVASTPMRISIERATKDGPLSVIPRSLRSRIHRGAHPGWMKFVGAVGGDPRRAEQPAAADSLS
jgi:hypothetical protein